MGDSLLSRVSAYPPGQAPLTKLQAQVDSAVSVSKKELLDPYQLIAMALGAAAYGAIRHASVRKVDTLIQRAGRFEGLVIKPGFVGRASTVAGSQARTLGSLETMVAKEYPALTMETAQKRPIFFLPSMIAGSTTYEMSHRALLSATGKGPENPDLWRWSGREGIANGLIRSSFVFGGALFAGDLAGSAGFALIKPSETVLRPAVAGLFAVSGFTGAYLGLNEFADWFSTPKEESKKPITAKRCNSNTLETCQILIR